MRPRSQRNVLRLTPGALLTFILLSAGAAPADGPYTGWIESFNGPSRAYVLLREKMPVDVALFTPLEDGDWIVIREKINDVSGDSENRIALALGDGKKLTLTYQDTPYRVESAERPVTLTANLMRWARDYFKDLQGYDYQARVVSLVTRNDSAVPLAVPLLAPPETRLASGERALYLAWQGGEPPFRLAVARELTGETLLSEENVSEHHLELGSAVFVPGAYQLRLTDAQDSWVALRFVVVPASELPRMPPDLARDLERSALPESTRTILQAAWLAEQDEIWRLEAYQRAAESSGDAYAAQLLRRLLRGDL